MNYNTRKIAFEILYNIKKNKEFSNLALNKYMPEGIDPRDRKLVTKIVYGTIENVMLIDYYINKISNVSTKKMDIDVLLLLRIAIYQIIFLDKIPNHAAVNESVKIIKKTNPRLSGFVNGVLRNFLRKKDNLTLPSKKDMIKHLSVKFSHPQWLIKDWIKEYSEEDLIDLLIANNKTAHMVIRVNTLKITKEELIVQLKNEGVIAQESQVVEEALIIKESNISDLTCLKTYQKGYFQVQDESSMLVAKILDPKPTDKVLDMCSAPGGKTTHIAQLMNNQGEVVARDIHEFKKDLIQMTAKRLGLSNITIEIKDGSKFYESSVDGFDKVLVDAPCSGLGIIRRKPEIKYNRPKKELPALQLQILENASRYVKSGGNIVYSTCTISKAENNDVIHEFLKKHPNFEVEDIEISNLNIQEKMVQLLPSVHQTDGFFICKLTKK